MTLKMFESGWNLMQQVNLTSNHPSEIKKMSLNEYIFFPWQLASILSYKIIPAPKLIEI